MGKITDVRPEELIEFLKFFYPRIQNSLKIRRGSVPALLYLAEKYQVEEIKAMCELRIRTEMLKERTVGRVAPWLKLAYDYRLRELQSESTARIAKMFPNFDRTPTFRALPPELKLEVIAHSKSLIQDHMKQLRDIAFDVQTGDGNESSSHQTTYKNRVIYMQSYFNTWDSGDTSGKDESSASGDEVEDRSGDDESGDEETGGALDSDP